MLRNKHLKLQAQQGIMNVLHYFERERDNGGACTPFTFVMQVEQFFRLLNYYEMKSKSCHVTVATLKQEVSEVGVFNFSSASLTLLLHSIGFSFTKVDGRRGLYELDHIASSRIRFLRDYNTNKQSKDYDPVFLDETWIFSRGSPKKSWHDNTLKSIKKKPMGEGKRFNFLHAGNKDGFVPNASLLFSTKNSHADYHGDMCSKLFTKWFEEQLIPNLSEPSLIVLDNASYHSKLLEKIPNTSSTKEEICNYLQNHKIPFDRVMFKRELLELIQENRRPKKYEIDENGHKVLRLPPHHCQFNAIELFWANCKEF